MTRPTTRPEEAATLLAEWRKADPNGGHTYSEAEQHLQAERFFAGEARRQSAHRQEADRG